MDGDQPSVRFTSEKSIRAGLESLRRRRRRFWLLLFSAAPAAAALMILPGPIFPILTAAWLGGVAIAAWHSSVSRCPKCGEQFHYYFGISQLLTRRCVHCGLDMNADLKGIPLR